MANRTVTILAVYIKDHIILCLNNELSIGFIYEFSSYHLSSWLRVCLDIRVIYLSMLLSLLSTVKCLNVDGNIIESELKSINAPPICSEPILILVK